MAYISTIETQFLPFPLQLLPCLPYSLPNSRPLSLTHIVPCLQMQPTEFINTVPMYTCLWVTTWDQINYQGSHPGEDDSPSVGSH